VSTKAKLRKSTPLDLAKVERRKHSRDAVANLVTAFMLLLTLLVLAWVAYQINNPITIYVDGILGKR
jgi:hypothetical protein